LFVLVAGVLAGEPDRPAVLAPFDDRVATAILGRRATVRGAPEFGNRDGPSLPDGGTNTVAEPVGDLGRPVPGVGRDDVKGRPVDAVARQRGVADLPAEPCPDRLDGLAE